MIHLFIGRSKFLGGGGRFMSPEIFGTIGQILPKSSKALFTLPLKRFKVIIFVGKNVL